MNRSKTRRGGGRREWSGQGTNVVSGSGDTSVAVQDRGTDPTNESKRKDFDASTVKCPFGRN